MTQPRFTPGTWSVVKHDRFPFEREVKADDGYICEMEGLSDADMPTVEANAHLITAAPELYAALKRIVDDYGDCYRSTAKTTGPYQQAVSALAKADGRESQ